MIWHECVRFNRWVGVWPHQVQASPRRSGRQVDSHARECGGRRGIDVGANTIGPNVQGRVGEDELTRGQRGTQGGDDLRESQAGRGIRVCAGDPKAMLGGDQKGQQQGLGAVG